ISSVRLHNAETAHGSQSRNCRADRGTSRTRRTESAQAGTEAKVRAEIRRPRPCRRLTIGLLWVPVRDVAFSDQILVHQPLADDAGNGKAEAVRIAQSAPIVEPERLFVQIPEQVERFDAHVRALQRAL